MSKPVDDIEITYWNALRKGQPFSLEWIYDRYFKLLYNYGRKIGAERELLEDAIHDLFVDLWRFHENLSPTTSVRFYLYRSLRRRLVLKNPEKDLLKENHQAIFGNLSETVACKEQDIIDKEIQHHRANQLKKLLDNLSPRQYEALILRFYDELSFEEIGGVMNVNEQSARNLVQRGLMQLKHYSKLLLAVSVVMFEY